MEAGPTSISASSRTIASARIIRVAATRRACFEMRRVWKKATPPSCARIFCGRPAMRGLFGWPAPNGGERWQVDVAISRQNRRAMVRTVWIVRNGEQVPRFLNLLGFMMAVQAKDDGDAALLSAVALLRDLPEHRLVRGQVGAIVEALDDATSLVEFSDRGHAYAIVPCPRDALLSAADHSPGGLIGRGIAVTREYIPVSCDCLWRLSPRFCFLFIKYASVTVILFWCAPVPSSAASPPRHALHTKPVRTRWTVPLTAMTTPGRSTTHSSLPAS